MITCMRLLKMLAKSIQLIVALLFVVYPIGIHGQRQCTQGVEAVTTQPLCPDTQVTFACTVNGSNATIWTGSFFLCPDGYNESLLLHSEPNVTECGPFTAQIDESQSQGDCYVSTLNFNASLDLNGAVFECYNGDLEEMGNISLAIADPPRAPTLRISQCTNTTLTLEWDEPENGGMPITQYTIIPNPVVPPCGNYCRVDASVRQFRFGPLNHSQTYNFAVHADNCGGTQQGRLSNLTVFFGGPDGPQEINTFFVYDRDELQQINVSWQKVEVGQYSAECNLPVSEYIITYSGDFGGSSTFTVDATDCRQSWCNHVFESIDVSVPLYTVSISAVSELGAGRPAMANYVSGINDFIAISVNVSTPYPTADCQFLCGFNGVTNHNLNFMYNMEDNFTLPSVEEPSENGTTEAHMTFPLRDPMPPETYFYYQVLAFDEDQCVLILGNFTTGNYSDVCDVMELVQNPSENITCRDGRTGLRNSSGVILCYNETGPGTLVEYMCDSGYDLISTEELVLECQVNGLWDHQPDITCRTQPELNVGGIVGGAVTVLVVIIAIVVIVAVAVYYRKRLRFIHICKGPGSMKNTETELVSLEENTETSFNSSESHHLLTEESHNLQHSGGSAYSAVST